MHISTKLDWVNKVICGYTGIILKTFVKQHELAVFPHLFDEHPFNCSRMPVILPLSYEEFPVTNPVVQLWALSTSFWRIVEGSQTEHAYSRSGRINTLYAISVSSWGTSR